MRWQSVNTTVDSTGILLQQKIYRIIFFAIFTVSLIAVPFHMFHDFQNGKYLALGFLSIYLILLLIGFVLLIITRNITYTRIALVAAVYLLATWQLVDAGGFYGTGLLYFISCFSLLYFVLGFRGGIIFSFYFFIGLAIRFYVAPVVEPSIFASAIVRSRMLMVFFVATILGLVALVYQHRLVNYLSRLAYADSLTGLPNRLRISEYLNQKIKDGKQFYLVAIKIFNFGQLASHQGIDVGDSFLKIVAKRLMERVPDGTIASRWSGTMMMVCHEGLDPFAVREWSRDVLDAVQQPLEAYDVRLALRAGIAITNFPTDGLTIDRLVANLVSTIESPEFMIGKVRFFNENAWIADQRRFQLASAMKGAVERNEFSLRYHPKIRLDSGACSGAEVLLRWNHPELGSVSPAEFIPVAEATGYIKEVTSFVVHKFFNEFEIIQPLMCHVETLYSHAINLSPLDLANLDLPGLIRNEFVAREWNPSMLEFEITEGAMMSEDPQVGMVLAELKYAGFKLAIDDFGTGYSSLSYLHTIDADNLKIDQSFIRKLGAGQDNDPIVDAIILIAHSLGMKVTAEGVETEEQAAYLRLRGCDFAQGYLYAKPLSLDDYLTWLASCSCRDD